ncbi:MAG: creatininase family protein [Spirochaetes bacterium]|nr:creatininase family protein [Spirochaetota bacterium]
MNMMNLKWTDVKDAVQKDSIVLFPIGVIEEHGPHLCLGTDIYTAEILCSNIQKELHKHGINSIIAPPFYWGICQSTKGFIGSFTIKMDTAKSLIMDILASLYEFGFREVYGINAHGDIEQNILLMNSFKEAAETTGIAARCCFRSEVMHFYGLTGEEQYICPVLPQQIEVSNSDARDIHAGDIETAIINRYYPAFADPAAAENLPSLVIEPEREMEWVLGGKTEKLSAMGYMGNPANYQNVKIEEHINDITVRYTEAILKKRSA